MLTNDKTKEIKKKRLRRQREREKKNATDINQTQTTHISHLSNKYQGLPGLRVEK